MELRPGIKLQQNPKGNYIVEKINQVIVTLVRMFEFKYNYLDKKEPWAGILAATDFTVKNTYHITLQSTPGQLVYRSDMILNEPFIYE